MPEPPETDQGRPVDTVQAQLDKLRKKYGRELPEKVARVEAAFAQLLGAPWEEQPCKDAYRQIHSLAGSSGTYGFMEFAKIARAVETLLKQCLESRSIPPDPWKGQVNDGVAKLREMASVSACGLSP